MKTIYSMLLGVAVATVTLSSCARTVYVRERPAPPPYVMRPAPPYASAVWIPEEYIWTGGRYSYIAPHYTQAPRGRVWVSGYWNAHRGRSTWVKGYWRR